LAGALKSEAFNFYTAIFRPVVFCEEVENPDPASCLPRSQVDDWNKLRRIAIQLLIPLSALTLGTTSLSTGGRMGVALGVQGLSMTSKAQTRGASRSLNAGRVGRPGGRAPPDALGHPLRGRGTFELLTRQRVKDYRSRPLLNPAQIVGMEGDRQIITELNGDDVTKCVIVEGVNDDADRVRAEWPRLFLGHLIANVKFRCGHRVRSERFKCRPNRVHQQLLLHSPPEVPGQLSRYPARARRV